MAIAGVIGLSMEVWPFVNEQFEVTVSHSLPLTVGWVLLSL